MILRRTAAGIVLYAYGAAADECTGCTKKLFLTSGVKQLKC